MTLQLKPASSASEEAIQWLWPQRVARGCLTVLEGDPGVSKSTIIADLAARVSTGRAMPLGGDKMSTPGTAVLLQGEDPESRTRRLLQSAGADLDRVHIRAVAGEDWFSLLPRGANELRQLLRPIRPHLLVIDPLSSFIEGGLQHEKTVRRALAPLESLAHELQTAVVLVRHLRKSSSQNLMYDGAGSIGIAGLVRSLLRLSQDPLNRERKYLTHVKTNLARTAKTIALMLSQGSNSESRVEWLREVNLSASQVHLLSGFSQGSAVHEAAIFLVEALRSGPLAQAEVRTAAKEHNIADRTLDRAKACLGVQAKREGFGAEGHWIWLLPDQDSLAQVEDMQAQIQFCNGLARKRKRRVTVGFSAMTS